MNRINSVFRLLCFALCAALFAPSACLATTYYVATTGSDANSGTQAQPFATIGKAVTISATNNTILVADGTYTGAGNRNIDFGGKDLTVQSASGNPANCIIDCQQSGCAFILQNKQTANSNIAGFTIKNGSGYNNTNGGGVFIATFVNNYPNPNDSPVVNNCIFTNNIAANISTTSNGGGMYGGTAINCTFNGNTANGVHGSGGGLYGGIATNCTFTGNVAGYFLGGSGGGMCGVTATNCIFTNNTIYGYGGGMGGGTAINCVFFNNGADNSPLAFSSTPGLGGGTDSAHLYFCTVVGNYASVAGGGISDGSATNSIIWGNDAQDEDDDVYSTISGGPITYSLVEGGFNGTGNIDTDPKFVNFLTGNLHLSAGSPCINLATTTVPTGFYDHTFPFPATDLDGGKRIIGTAPDMGAYEYGSSVVGTLTMSGLVATAPSQHVTFQFRPVGGGTTITQTSSVPASGGFTLYGIPNGSYTLWVKPDIFLASVVPVTVSGGNASGITATLEPGDANNSNMVDAADFNVLAGAFGGTGYNFATGYDPTADFNGDGNIDTGDVNLLIGSFGQSGAP